MQLDDVRAIARLARLSLTDEELEAMASELSDILVHMDALRALDTSGVEPMTHALAGVGHTRDDRAVCSLDDQSALGQAPESAAGHFQVPNIIDTAS